MEPNDIEFNVRNIVASGTLGNRVKLERLKEDLQPQAEAWFEDGDHPGLYIRRRDHPDFQLHDEYSDGDSKAPLTTFHKSGKYIIRGKVEEVDALTKERDEVLDLLRSLEGDDGTLVGEEALDLDVSNVVAEGRLPLDVNLTALSTALGVEADYEPEQFPALTYRSDEFTSTILIYSNGKTVIAGADSPGNAETELHEFAETVDHWMNADVPGYNF